MFWGFRYFTFMADNKEQKSNRTLAIGDDRPPVFKQSFADIQQAAL
jgi:hypothetical protein